MTDGYLDHCPVPDWHYINLYGYESQILVPKPYKPTDPLGLVEFYDGASNLRQAGAYNTGAMMIPCPFHSPLPYE